MKTKLYKVDKDTLLKEMPELLYKLKVEYNFWWGMTLCRPKKKITELVEKTKNRHRVTVYLYEDKSLYFVIYCNKKTDIYYCNDYKDDKNDNRVLYFIRKLKKYYLEASKEYEIRELQADTNWYKDC